MNEQPMTHGVFRDTVRAVITCKGLVLMVQHRHIGPENQGTWGLPGGVAEDKDQSLEDALLREIYEELHIHATLVNRVGVWQQARDGRTRSHHVFHVTVPLPVIHPDPNELIAAIWFAPQAVDYLTTTLGWEADAIQRVFASFSLE